jgi:protein subunit release factor B
MLSDEGDSYSSTDYCSAGGTESCIWAEMLYAVHVLMWGEKYGIK